VQRALISLTLLLVSALAVVSASTLRRVGVAQGYSPEQPIAFSHALHAGREGIACLYCHSAAETSRHAGIPALSVCMNCHGQLTTQTADLARLKEAFAQQRPIRWVKVHNLPDFVFFSHARHVDGQVACQSCHGAVETMTRMTQHAPLTMGWCLDCHRQQAATVRDVSAVSGAGAREAAGEALLDCSRCHY
jgi:hypothetical protein